MNAREAREKAIRLWGRFGAARADPVTSLCQVGVIKKDLTLEVRGFGRWWEEAFDDADKNKKFGIWE